jgi:hypothetical protein
MRGPEQMSIERQIQDQAGEIASDYQQRIDKLERELRDLEARKLAVEEALRTASIIPKRLARFKPKIGTEHQCPRCWLEQEARSTLEPIGGGTRHEDDFRCRSCGFQLTIPF